MCDRTKGYVKFIMRRWWRKTAIKALTHPHSMWKYERDRSPGSERGRTAEIEVPSTRTHLHTYSQKAKAY